MLTDEELQAIEKRAADATPGPWTVGFNGAMRAGWAILKANTSRAILNLDPTKNIDLDLLTHQVDSDLDFIQNAKEDIERLLKEVKELRLRVQQPGEPLTFQQPADSDGSTHQPE